MSEAYVYEETPVVTAAIKATEGITDIVERTGACVKYRRDLEEASIGMATTAAERMGVDPIGLSTALQNGEIAELVECLQNFVNGATTGEIQSNHDETLSNAVIRSRAILTKLKGQGDEQA